MSLINFESAKRDECKREAPAMEFSFDHLFPTHVNFVGDPWEILSKHLGIIEQNSIINKIMKFLLGIGPGIFAIGYTIGTGSVTAMIKAGSEHGMQLLWVLLLSCLFSWVLIEAYGRYALVTGETALHAFRKRFPRQPSLRAGAHARGFCLHRSGRGVFRRA